MDAPFIITTPPLSLDELKSFLQSGDRLALGTDAKAKIKANRIFLEKKLAVPGARYYGINTGFGALCDVQVPAAQLDELQENMVMSNA